MCRFADWSHVLCAMGGVLKFAHNEMTLGTKTYPIKVVPG